MSTSRPWIRTALVVAVIYVLTGLVTVATSRAAGAAGMPMAVRAIRGLSWLWSALVFLLHTILENRSRPRLAVAAGQFFNSFTIRRRERPAAIVDQREAA